MNELPDIPTAISKPELFAAFRLQLKKDLELCGMDSEFTDQLPPDYPSLLGKLSAFVEVLSGKQHHGLSTLLYRIDITEKQVKEYTHAQPDSPLPAVIAELIIKRELQKVILKQYFK